MENRKLKTAIFGVRDDKGQLLQTAIESKYFEVTAIADKDTESAETAGKKYDCQWFDDYRLMVNSCKADCLLVAAGLYSTVQHVILAIEKGIHVFKITPPAQNFAQASELINLANKTGIKFAVSTPLRYCESFNGFKEFVRQENGNHFSLLTADCCYVYPDRPAWHNDPELAGGGVLLRDSYEIIDLVTGTFGMPQQVYALMTNNAEDKQQRHALTEDIAVVIMKFPEDLNANITLRRTIGKTEISQTINCFGKDKILSANDNTFEIKNLTAQCLKTEKYKIQRQEQIARNLDNFTLSILQPDETELICSPDEHLRNMAVIEAAYLSSRTAMPEEPARILSLA